MNTNLQQLSSSLPVAARVQLYSAIAEEFWRGGNWDDADRFYRHAIDIAAVSEGLELAGLYKARGTLLYRMGRWREALETYERGLSLLQQHAPTSTSAILNGIGLQQYSLGNWRVATHVFKSAIDTAPSPRERLYAECNLAMVAGERGWHRESLTESQRVADDLLTCGDNFGSAVALTNALYMAALLGDIDACNALDERLTKYGEADRLDRLRFGVVDSRAALAFQCGEIDRATALVEQMKEWAASDVPWYFSGARVWAVIREATWLRVTNDAAKGRDLLSDELQRGTWSALAKVNGLFQLALCASDCGDQRTSALAGREALRLFRTLGFSQTAIVEKRKELALGNVQPKSISIGGLDVFAGFLGDAKCIVAMKASLRRVAGTMATVLVVGETGTGKSMLAALIHRVSPRGAGPFVRLDCTCHGDALIDSLLFGHRRGAFTGAVADQKGLIATAEGGTLFIDEVSELPLPLQGKLLTLLEEGTFRMVGATSLRDADVRLIVATNKCLEEEVAKGRFRQDLLYRLGEVRISVPPLREHMEDIPALAEALLANLCVQHRQIKRLSGPALRALGSLAWPGNVRQLRKVLERAVVLGESTVITPSDLGLQASKDHVPAHNLLDVQRQHVSRVLLLTGGNKSEAARLLGLKRSTLYSRLEALGLY